MNRAKWTLVKSFESDLLVGKVYTRNHVQMKITGTANRDIEWSACAPADMRTSHSGSGLPFGSYKMAFSHGVQKGLIGSGRFKLYLIQPNSYYDKGELIPPMLYVSDRESNVSIHLTEPIPNRSLHSLPNRPKRNARGRL